MIIGTAQSNQINPAEEAKTKNAPTVNSQCILEIVSSPHSERRQDALLGDHSHRNSGSDVTMNLDSNFVLTQLTQRTFRQSHFGLT